MCKGCNKITEMNKEIKHESGYENTYFTCSECGHIEKMSINKVHYGNDEIKR